MTTQLGRGEVHGSVATHVVRATYIVLAILILSPASRSQTIISYNAGKAGEPPTAPDPTRQGWTFGRTGAHTELTAGPVSPDGTTGLNAWNVTIVSVPLRVMPMAFGTTLGSQMNISWRLVCLDGP